MALIRFKSPVATPRSVKIISIHGCVPRILSSQYPKNSPTAMDEGSMSPIALNSAIFWALVLFIFPMITLVECILTSPYKHNRLKNEITK